MPDIEGQVTRREVLKAGLLGAAGLTVLPAVLAACSGSTATPSGGGGLSGNATLGSNLSDAVPKKALQDAVDLFTKANSGVTVKINTVDHSTFQDTISNYLQGTPDDVLTWFSGFRMRAFVVQNLFTPIDDVWADRSAPTTPRASRPPAQATTAKMYMVPFDTYAWTVYYRPERLGGQGLQDPDDPRRDEDPRREDEHGWPRADRPWRQGRLAGDGPLRHHQPARERLPVPCRPDGRQAEVDRREGQARSSPFGRPSCPSTRPAAAGRIWQDAAKGLVAKTTGMMLQPQVAETFAAAGDPADSPTSTSSRGRTMGRSGTPRRPSMPRSTATC